jgi:DNA-binding NarL/FixJ family response regulator
MKSSNVHKIEFKRDENEFHSKRNAKKYFSMALIKEMKSAYDISYNETLDLLKEFETILSKKNNFKLNQKKIEVLTPKEREVFDLVSKGFTTKEIAIRLFVETSTVSIHRKHIIQKLGFKNLYEWFLFANNA